MGRRLAGFALPLALLVGGAAAAAAEDSDDERRQRRTGRWLEDRAQYDPRPYEEGVLAEGWPGTSFFLRKDRMWLEDGVAFGGYFSANVQSGSEGGKAHSISETLLLATWEPVRRGNTAGRLVMGFAYDFTFGRPTTRKFADNLGLVETPNDLDTDPDLNFATLGLLHWEQEYHRGSGRGWGWRAGQLYGPSYFGISGYLDDDRSYFMARPLATPAGAQWVGGNDIGLGVDLTAWNGPWYVSAAAMDGKANRQYPHFSSLADGQLLYLGEVGLEFDRGGPNEAAVRLTGSHLDVHDGAAPDKGPGQSAMVSGYRTFAGRWALSGRWSRSWKRLSSDYRELYALGLLSLRPLSRSLDVAGLGVFTGQPSDASRGTESGAELFYRLQLTQALNLMGSAQYWSRDRAGGGSGAWVGGLRVNFEF